LTVGRFVTAKGLHVLIDALAVVVDRVGPAVTAVFAGSTDLSDVVYLRQLEAQVEHHGLGSVVEFRPNLDDRQLWHEYDQADVLVSPSFHEGLCVPVIEAYIAGCRVVATDGGNLPFVVQPPDPIVPTGDVEALADAVVSALESGRRPHPARAAVDRLIATYSRQNSIDELRRAVFEEVSC
jgi:glycosyltransferase involved in cell wall biosynthesis